MIANTITAINLSGAANDTPYEYSSYANMSLIYLKLNHSLSWESTASLLAAMHSKGAGH